MAECVDIIRAAASGQNVNYDGELYRVANLCFGWLESEPPPVFVGASQDQMLRMATRVAHGNMMSDMPATLASAALETVAAALEKNGRDRSAYQTNAFAAWHVYDDGTEACSEARKWLVLRGIFRPWVLGEFLDTDEVDLVMNSVDAFWASFRSGSPDVEGVPGEVLNRMVENLTFTGSPGDLDQVVDKLNGFSAAGLDAISLRLYSNPAESIRLIGERIVPAMA